MEELAHFKKIIDAGIQSYLTEIKPQKEMKGLIELHRAMGYSLTSGGSRFRPILSLLVAETLGTSLEKVLPFALAVELVHTYSLIHDDLPAMDNDDLRRGQPTNHKVFGEPLAMLAGDALATEPYRYLTEKYPAVEAMALVKILAEAAGPQGMVGGQAIDVSISPKDRVSAEDIEYLHQCKTMALFRAAVNGAAYLSGVNDKQKQSLAKDLDAYAQSVGLLFQVADDIADGASDKGPSFVKAVGLEKARKYCQNLRNSAIEKVPEFEKLQGFAQLIFERSKDVSGKSK